ncbi:MAG: hypothetical protein AABX83_02930 [Nanoarchaeota archaeon]
MELIKINTSKEKTEEEKLWELRVKFHLILSNVFRLLSDEYPEKFGEKINGSINGETITLTGDLDIMKTEVHEKVIEFNDEKRYYKIILKNLK